MSISQIFCAVSELVADSEAPGGDEARLYQAIRDASDFLQKEIGWFIPVTETRRLDGNGEARLDIPPLLELTTIINDDDTLTSSDYLLYPDNRHWPNGPYSWIVVDPDSTTLQVWLEEAGSVQITGKWGLYNRQVSTGAAVGTGGQDSSVETLLVDNGGKVSPGMLLLIESEQELVTGWDDPTEGVTTLGAALAASDETVTLSDGSLVNVGEIIRVEFERMKVLDKQSNTIAVVRGWNGTARVAHSSGANVDVYRTVTVERAVNGTSAASHDAAKSISRYVVPDDILYLTRQIATLMINKARSGYAGKTGNPELGEVFYHDAFPRFEIERIKQNYEIHI